MTRPQGLTGPAPGPAQGGAPAPAEVCLGLGSNLGDREAMIRAAVSALREEPGIELVAVSGLVRSRPVAVTPRAGGEAVAGGEYLNAAVRLRTALAPDQVLAVCLRLERRLGRDRAAMLHGHPRTIDLDLLLYADRAVREPGLVVPHPGLPERLFVLEPLAEIAGEMPVPGTGRTVRQLRDARRALVGDGELIR
jgi:2-amino-4-hydroxy-6-hydroxymethyldihydropteridine diphosphokinase